MELTEEQQLYISYDKETDTKLIAVAGAGKTACIIQRMEYLIKNKYKTENILMLTFSKFTRDDFINKIKKNKKTLIELKQIKTIDSFAKSIIDCNNEVDISLLSFVFMEYLQNESKDELIKNKKLNNIITIFVDEAQDLNEIQYNILMELKNKLGIYINLIGDPNQNIYQFRNSSDKYLRLFDAKTFYLTKNFRSNNQIISFSKWLRPVQSIDITGHIGESECKPSFVFYETEKQFETNLINLLTHAKKINIDFCDIAILSPTRGRMGKNSHGLCFISNILYKNNIKFKQFYEEATDNFNGNIKYKAKSGYLNVLTYMGSKGLEWKFVILVDADICLINKRHFTFQKHNDDQYLLYVACSRAKTNLCIFTKYNIINNNIYFNINPWFKNIPKHTYNIDKIYTNVLTYPTIKEFVVKNTISNIVKKLDNLNEKNLNMLSKYCNYGKIKKTIFNVVDEKNNIVPNMFINKFIKNLFIVYYQLFNGLPKKKFMEIENILNNKKIITNIPNNIAEWIIKNKMNWSEFDKAEIDDTIRQFVNNNFDRKIKFEEHIVVNNGFYKLFISNMSDKIKKNYQKYLSTFNTKKIRKYLFNIIITIYSIDTQHYFHIYNNGKKFKDIILNNTTFLDSIEYYAKNIPINIIQFEKHIENHCVIDIIENKNDTNVIWNICCSEITLKNILYMLYCNIGYYNLQNILSENDFIIDINFINLLSGNLIIYHIDFNKTKIDEFMKILSDD